MSPRRQLANYGDIDKCLPIKGDTREYWDGVTLASSPRFDCMPINSCAKTSDRPIRWAQGAILFTRRNSSRCKHKVAVCTKVDQVTKGGSSKIYEMLNKFQCLATRNSE